MLYDKVGTGIFRALYFIGKFLGLVALDYDSGRKVFHTSISATVVSSVICIFVAIISPIVVKWNSEIYYIADVPFDENMSLVTTAQLCVGFATSFVILVCQLWKRVQVARNANDFREVFHQLTIGMGCGHIITLEIVLLIALKLSITMYEVLINFPYLMQYGGTIAPERLVAFFLNLYIAEIGAVFSDITFAALLLLARYFHLANELLESLTMEIQAEGMTQRQIRKWRWKLHRLIRLYLRIRQMLVEFAGCIEISILVQVLNSFANILSNLFALLDFFVNEKYFEEKSLVYTVMIFVNICLLVHAAEMVKQRSAELKDTLLDLEASRGHHRSGWRSDVLPFKICPEVLEVSILGMFPLNNTFLLFLTSYSSNFIIIILQFELSRIK